MTGPPKAARRLPAGLIGALVVVAGLEWLVTLSADRLATHLGLAARFAGDAAARRGSESGVLALGDSVVKMGFDPSVIERELGLPAYNLAVPGSPSPLSYALLRRALDAGARPKAIVIGHMIVTGNPRAQAATLSEVLGLDECAALAWRAHDPALFGTLAAHRLLPSLRYRHGLRLSVSAALDGTPVPDPGVWLRESWISGRGMQRLAEGHEPDGWMDPRVEHAIAAEEWKVLPAYATYVRGIAELAEARGIPIFWLVPPIVPEAQARRDVSTLDERHTRNLRAIQRKSPNLIVLDARHSGYPASAFFDTCHLNGRGAARLTADIAAAIRDHGEDRAWVALPAFDAGPSRLAGRSKGSDPRR